MSRYEEMFSGLGGRGAFVPFAMLGDPSPRVSLQILVAMVDAGADALELGVPFSDPVADGPTVQRAGLRASMTTVGQSLEIVRRLRSAGHDVPVGLLVYANLVVRRGADAFYGACADAGVDSVLVADVPTLECAPFVEAASRHDVAPVLIAAPNTPVSVLERIAEMGRGYTYVVSRRGVTGAEEAPQLQGRIPGRLRELGAPPPVVGFGISRPEHVRMALDAGAAGAISGSAVIRRIEENLGNPDDILREVGSFVREMVAATR